jgi:methyl-accepting chemotaxis protein
MNHVSTEVRVGIDIVQESGEIFERIYKSIDGIAGQIKEVSCSTEELHCSRASIDINSGNGIFLRNRY